MACRKHPAGAETDYLCSQRGIQGTREEERKGRKEEIRAGEEGTEREGKERTGDKEEI